MKDLFGNPIHRQIKISVKSLKQKFQRCEPEYIKSVCHGRCCEGTGGIMVTVHESEVERIEGLGVKVKNGFIQADTGCSLCPFKKDDLCSIHEEKPFGCKASPFTLSKRYVLIVRNRYRMLGCYNTPDAIPAYEAHRWSLEQIFGKEVVKRIIDEIESGSEDVYAEISDYNFQMLIDNDKAKKKFLSYNKINKKDK